MLKGNIEAGCKSLYALESSAPLSNLLDITIGLAIPAQAVPSPPTLVKAQCTRAKADYNVVPPIDTKL